MRIFACFPSSCCNASVGMLIAAVLLGEAARAASPRATAPAGPSASGHHDMSKQQYHTAKADLHKQMSRTHLKHALVSTPKHAVQAVVGGALVEPARAARAALSGKPKQAGAHLQSAIRRPLETTATSLSAGMYSLQRGASHRTMAKTHTRKASEASEGGGQTTSDSSVGSGGGTGKPGLSERLRDAQKSVTFEKKYFDKYHDEIGAYAIGKKDQPANPDQLNVRRRRRR